MRSLPFSLNLALLMANLWTTVLGYAYIERNKAHVCHRKLLWPILAHEPAFTWIDVERRGLFVRPRPRWETGKNRPSAEQEE